ncbi:hypothetical protein [Citricoccus nitrophenolicus]|uniref:hypothetical protein n=1 Tax=Citricoccus nitrophenolicus TaxID=863575 RepID=UPI0031F10C76
MRSIKPPRYPHEDALLCYLEEDGVVDGVLYAGTPSLDNKSGRLLVPVYVLARSNRARGKAVGASAMQQLEDIASKAAAVFLDIETVYFAALVHKENKPCRSLLASSGWWENGSTNDPEYDEWWYSIGFED